MDAWINRGLLRRRKKDYSGAISDWEQLLKLAPNHRQAADFRVAIKKMRQQLENREK